MTSTIQKYMFKGNLPMEFEVLDIAEIFKHKKAMMVKSHRAQFYHILFLEKAKGVHYVDFKPIPLEDHIILFIAANSVNKFDPDGLYQGSAILFTDNFFCKNKEDARALYASPLFADFYQFTFLRLHPKLSELTILRNAIQSEFVRGVDGFQSAILHNLLHVFLLHSERVLQQQGVEKLESSWQLEQVLQFKSLLDAEYMHVKAVKYYASRLNLSEKQLTKVTKKLLDKTPKQLIDERIVLEAKRILAHSQLSVKEIAYALGYEEPSNFVKYFKRHCKITPVAFRKASQ